MIRAAQAVFFTALSIWVGGLATLALVVAPAAFRTLDRPSAGRVFGTSLRVFSYVELACAVLVSVSALLLRPAWPGRGGAVRLALIALMVVLLLVHMLAVAPAVAAERLQVSGFDTLPPDAPQKARFNRLHRASERLVGLNLLLGFAVLILSAAAAGRPPQPRPA